MEDELELTRYTEDEKSKFLINFKVLAIIILMLSN